MSVCLGCTVKLPSNLHVSALDAQKIVWHRITQVHNELIENPHINPDYSITMTNVGRGDSGTYYASAIIKGSNRIPVKGAKVELLVFMKPCEELM